MRADTKIFLANLRHLGVNLRRNGRAQAYAADPAPLRSELFSADQMEQHGKALAASHVVSRERGKDQLLPRLAENEEVLISSCELLMAAAKVGRRVTPAGEWLLDNFYLIEDQIRTAKMHLPKGYSRELPRLSTGPSAGLPRVYDIALETISHGDGRVDPEALMRFVAAYQSVTPLNLGELWAIPIMLRLALIENLRRVASILAASRIDRDLANDWADQMIDIAAKDPKSLILVIADMARSNPPMVSSFVSELARLLQGQSSALALPLNWVDQRLSETGQTIEQMIQAEAQRQAADQLSISNTIGSLRFLSAMDWREFVETMSVVDQTLREDPIGTYGQMDFATRDRYRHVVERIAKCCGLPEPEIARRAVQLARDVTTANGVGRAAHVGFYLIGKGLQQLEQNAQAKISTSESIRQLVGRFPLFFYLSPVFVITLALTAAAVEAARGSGLSNAALALVGAVSALCVSQFAVALTNWLVTMFARPHKLPRMDFSHGIPPESRTLVVVPTLLVNLENVEHLLEGLEIRFLANQDENLHFGLLTDFRDSDVETSPEDESLLQAAEKGIDELNAKYLGENSDRFFLFHRPRRWNPRERKWMGYERKRGKLSDLNALLRGNSGDRFSRIVGDTDILTTIQFVITLDTDTQLPRESAWQCVASMSHPLNRAEYDERKQRVVEGYGILQPRVSVSLPSAGLTQYARLFGCEAGIDPYTRAISDVYQDLFGEGSFIGKGIYDVDAFEQSLDKRFPENRILSHDLLEGCYARAGLLSDVQLYEEYPSSYLLDRSRMRRWIRGDWQIARWLLPRVPGLNGAQKNPLTGLSRWKIFDNLRRSLVPPGLTLLMALGLTILKPHWLWILSVFGIIFIPPIISAIPELLRRSEDVPLSQHLSSVAHALVRRLAQAAFILMCLPYEGISNLGTILRTWGRMWITRRRLLEWEASNQAANNLVSLAGTCRAMWFNPVFAAALTTNLAASTPTAFNWAAPLFYVWFTAPAIVWRISLPFGRRKPSLTADQTIFLRKISRKTWSFFETFVTPEDNWLPPDNYQEQPVAVVAHRTSPTNIGLSLLANLSAYDFGYISVAQLIERTRNTFHTMEQLERSRGHFFNWYDTRSLRPLTPIFISTVDSGNLAGHLLTMRPGLLAIPDDRIVDARLFAGLSDTVEVLIGYLGGAVPSELAQFRTDLSAVEESPPATLSEARRTLDSLEASIRETVTAFDNVVTDAQTLWWANALKGRCRDALDDLILLTPARASIEPDQIPTLRELARLETDPVVSLRAQERIAALESLAEKAVEFTQMDWDFLFDKVRHLLSLGYHVVERRLDSGCYDLLASEARLCSFVGIAQDKLSQENWFALGRQLVSTGAGTALVSWSGSMFEYLMPLLVMPNYENTLLDQTCKAAVKRQIEYGEERDVPWGISESGYNVTDANLNYQYRAFGVPGLGLKRGLAEDLVIAPYASVMALMVTPEAACINLQRITEEGFEGRYGFYEAIDYTPSRVPRGQRHAIVRSFMAHHQAMSFLSLAHLLHNRPMQQRFESDPAFQATTLLLQERVLQATRFRLRAAELSDLQKPAGGSDMPLRILNGPDTRTPEVQLLSNGRYHVMVTNAGGGYSRWKDLAVTRWREDSTCDNWGSFCYIRDVRSGRIWSTAYQPALKRPDTYQVIFSEGRAEFRRRDLGFDTHTEIAVSPEDDIELRRVTITNSSRTRKTLDVTSYAEVVLTSHAADALHPAFSNLFVQTEIVAGKPAILCTRRPRSRDEVSPWMFHLMAVHGATVEHVSCETDRMAFVGRGNTLVNPRAVDVDVLSGSQGSVLDPIAAIRSRIVVESGESVVVDIVSGIGENRDACVYLVEKYQDRRLADRVFDLAWTHTQVVLRQINVSDADAQLYARLAGSIIYANSLLRAEPGIVSRNTRGQSGLWGYAISGDLPIVLLQITEAANIDLVRQLVQAHVYWRLKGLAVDLVIWNEDHSGYRQLLHEQIMELIAASAEPNVTDRPGGIFVRPADQISNEDRILLQSVARVVISDARGPLTEQFDRPSPAKALIPPLVPTRPHRSDPPVMAGDFHRDLIFFNGLGGFTPDGREYVINTAEGQVTPAPWVNVLANATFGTVVSESGCAYTWSENAHEYRLTPWNNDPVTDASGEAFYLRDEETTHFWSPTPLPRRGAGSYLTRHGFGYTVFEHTEAGIRSEMWVYVALDAPVKFAVLKVRNVSGRARRLSATGYVEWVLGDLRPKSLMHVITDLDSDSGALLARNPYNTEFPGRAAFFDVSDRSRAYTGDRIEFLGRNGTISNPAAMGRSRLSGRVGAALDPCAAIQVPFELADGQEREIVFTLGAGRDVEDAGNLARRFRGSGPAFEALEAVWQYWKHTLGAVHVQTPSQSVNVLTNGWLLYQTLACRLWARSGYYQSGGAFGFRDQLQDSMALIHAEPALVRAQLLLSASRQFREGDVQHWWHPPSGRGVRTHCSDDYLWLPFVTSRFVESTGDIGVLDEQIHFIEGRPVNADEDSYYGLATPSTEQGSLYEHCVRAIRNGLRFGAHGLPLIGSGDWNDGMNLVGKAGKGESVWLGFFLYTVLLRFRRIALRRGDESFAEQCRSEAARLRQNIEDHGWDGDWYRRAYFDDGTPLGSIVNEECQIDSISQSWSVLSGAGDPNHSRTAMEAVDRRLVRRDAGLIQLLDPPFDKSDLDPGYIKGYVPGVRENGGQYTHAAIWAVMAFAKLADNRRAWELFEIINPVNHARSANALAIYKVEPYVVAADVYAVPPHTGRGGWTWYTGSAGWMYRLIVESLLGLRLEVDKLRFSPCLPADWKEFKLHYRYRETVYHITFLQITDGEMSVSLDGADQPDKTLPLVDDRQEHSAEVKVAPRKAGEA